MSSSDRVQENEHRPTKADDNDDDDDDDLVLSPQALAALAEFRQEQEQLQRSLKEVEEKQISTAKVGEVEIGEDWQLSQFWVSTL